MINKNKKVILLLLCTVLFNSIATAQVAKDILSKYPAEIVYRLYCITTKTELTAAKQKLLADHFLNEDKLANKALLSGINPVELSSYYVVNRSYLKSVLTPLELNDFDYTPNSTDHQINKAIKFRTQLNLTTEQVKELFILKERSDLASTSGQSLLANVNKKTEGEQVSQILSERQYHNFLDIVVLPAATATNESAWAELKSFKIVTQADSARLYQENLNYFTKTGSIEIKANNDPKVHLKIDSVRSTFFAYKPINLLKLDMENNTLPGSQFTDVLVNRDLLNLTAQQTDSLIANFSKGELIKLNYKSRNAYSKYDANMFEGKAIRKTLTPEQYNAFLNNKNRPNAIVSEKKIWNRLKQYGLTANIDSASINNELINYELNLLVAGEKYHLDDSPLNAEYKDKVEHNKPAILIKLDNTIKSNTPSTAANKSLSW